LNQEVVKSCVKASNLKNAKPDGDVINFDDQVGYSALVIRGTYSHPNMRNKSGRFLCLYNKQNGKAFVEAIK
jgi:hypothetical protein